MPDITEAAHQRDGEGDLLPITKTVPVRGEGEMEVDVIPATSGQRREWMRRLQADAADDEDADASDELDDELEADLLDTFAAYDPEDFNGAESWNDVRPAITDALANAIFAELFDTGEDDFEAALDDAMAEVTEGNPEMEGEVAPEAATD